VAALANPIAGDSKRSNRPPTTAHALESLNTPQGIHTDAISRDYPTHPPGEHQTILPDQAPPTHRSTSHHLIFPQTPACKSDFSSYLTYLRSTCIKAFYLCLIEYRWTEPPASGEPSTPASSMRKRLPPILLLISLLDTTPGTKGWNIMGAGEGLMSFEACKTL